MKAKALLAVIILLLYSLAAAAQGYSIRIVYNTNLRDGASLDSGIITTAPAGSTLQVLGQQGRWLQINWHGAQLWMAGWVSYSRVDAAAAGAQPQTQIDNCCFVDRQCLNDAQWVDGYWAYQNGQCPTPAQSQPQIQVQSGTGTPALSTRDDIDNCCHLDRECHSEEQWRAGWVAFKNLECWDEYHAWYRTPDPGAFPAAGSDNCCTAPGWLCLNDLHFERGRDAFIHFNHCNQRIIPTYLPSYQYYDIVDNCCHLGRDCQTEADWQRGHSDFVHFKCEFSVPLINSMPVQIGGSATFKTNMRAVFSLLKAKSPSYFNYVSRGLDFIDQHGDYPIGSQHGGADYVYCDWPQRTYYSGLSDNMAGNWWRVIVQQINRMVHEACHCNRLAAGLDAPLMGRVIGDGVGATEGPCLEQQHLVMRQVDPADNTGTGVAYANIVRDMIVAHPWIEAYLEKPLSYYQHYLATGQ